MKDHYKLLGVSPYSTSSEIRAAYITKAKQTHPDKLKPEDRERGTILFQAIATAFAVLGDPTRKAEYDMALRGAKLPVESSASKTGALVPRPPSPSHGLGSLRPPSPSFARPPSRGSSSRPSSPMGFRTPLSSSRAHDNWSDPRVDPFAIFSSVLNMSRGGGGVDGGGGGGTGYRGDRGMGYKIDPYEDPTYMRPYERDTMSRMMDGVLPPNDPFRRGLPQEEMFDPGGAGSWGIPFPQDPWGRKFEGEIKPAKPGVRGRKMSATLTEGEKHRNGDFQMRNQTHNVEEGPDGSIRWTSHTIEVRSYSGQPRAARSSSRDRSGGDRYHRPHPPSPGGAYGAPTLARRSSTSMLPQTPNPAIENVPYPLSRQLESTASWPRIESIPSFGSSPWPMITNRSSTPKAIMPPSPGIVSGAMVPFAGGGPVRRHSLLS
ncbi:DnaJ-domain-containing protein [Meredithblackwellia eburnea MCA 4105]